MPDPIDLDELERVLASGPDLPLYFDGDTFHDAAHQVVMYASDGFNDDPSIVISDGDKATVLAAVNACPALIAEVRALRKALTEACDLADRYLSEIGAPTYKRQEAARIAAVRRGGGHA